MHSDSSPILQLDSVRKSFANVEAVRDLSLTVPRGSIYGLIGPNGAGKTTTLRMILNVFGPDSGTIRYGFTDGAADPVDRIGYLPEERGLHKKMTVEDVLVFLAEIKSVPAEVSRDKMGRWLETFGLADWRTRKVQELSKGMQQKLQFISTVLHEPELLVLDELFSGLDPVATEVLKDTLLDLSQHGTTILFSTHVMEQAEKICDHLCMIHRGEKVLDGSLDDVKNRFGAEVLAVNGELTATQLDSLPGVESSRSDRFRHELTLASDADIGTILRRLLEWGSVEGFERVRPSLHGIFLRIAKADDPGGEPDNGGLEEGGS